MKKILIVLLMIGIKPAFSQHKKALVQYFPSDYKEKTALDTLFHDWYSDVLRTMKEPVLFNDKTQAETYRFLWLRTFHNPVVIRIRKSQDNYTIDWRSLSGQSGYGLGKLNALNQKKITQKNWDDFLTKLQQINFWKLKKDSSYEIGFDGSQWLYEGKSGAKYQAVDKWSPQGKFYNCGNFLIELTGLKIKKEEIY